MTEKVDHPPHYQTPAGIEAIDVMERYGLGPHLFVAMKHLLRAGKKGDLAEDLRKADWYIKRLLSEGGADYVAAHRWEEWRAEVTPRAVCDAFGLQVGYAHATAVSLILRGYGRSSRAVMLREARKYIAEAIKDAEAQS